MALRARTHQHDSDGRCRYGPIEGIAQKAGHDLILAVGRREATVEVGHGTLVAVGFEADPS